MTFNGKQVAEAASRLRKRIAKIKEAYKEYDKQLKTNDPKKPSLRWALDGRTPKKLVLKKSTLTFRELFKRSLPSRFKTAKRDRVTIVSLARDKRNLNRLVSRSITYDFTSRPGRLITRKYNHVVIKLESNKKFVDSKVLFSCSCPDHKFSFEYALTKRGNSQIIYSNGEPSEQRNPRNIPSLCKHGIMLFKAVLEKRL